MDAGRAGLGADRGEGQKERQNGSGFENGGWNAFAHAPVCAETG